MSFRRSVALSFATQYVNVAIITVASIIIARYFLLPHDVGVFSVGMATALYLQTFQEIGIRRYLLQEKDLTQAKIETAYTFMILSTVVFAILLVGLHRVAADFYDEPVLGDVFLVLAICMLPMPLTTLATALQQRQSLFGSLFVINVVPTTIGAGVALVAAALDQGAMALAYQTLVFSVLRLVLAALYRPDILTVRPGWTEWRSVLRFGSVLTAVALYSSLLFRLPEPFIGRVWGLSAAGLYGRATTMSEQIRWSLYLGCVNAILAELVRRRDANESLALPFLKTTGYATALIWPVAAFIAVLSEPIILFLFGPKWVGVAPLLFWLSISEIVFSAVVLHYEIPTLLGRLRLYMCAELGQLTVGFALFIAGAMIGVEEAAASRVIYGLCFIALYIPLLQRLLGHRWTDLFEAYARSAGILLFGLAPGVAGFLAWKFGGVDPIAAVLVASAAFPPAWYLGVLATRHPVREEIHNLAQIALRRRAARI